MTFKPVRVILIGEAEKDFEQLNRVVGKEQRKSIPNSENQQLLRSIRRAVELLKENPMFGIQIKKKSVPKMMGLNIQTATSTADTTRYAAREPLANPAPTGSYQTSSGGATPETLWLS